MWTLPADASTKLDTDGFFFGEDLVSPEAIATIRSELGNWTQVPAVNGYGCIFQFGDALLQNLGLYSKSVLRLAVDDRILDFMEAYYGEPVVLGKCEYRRAVERKEEMALHSDGTLDLSVFIYLSGVDSSLGATAVIPGTHKIGVVQPPPNGGYPQIPDEARARYGVAPIEVRGGPGVSMVFNNNSWHLRTKTSKPGREVIWLTYSPLSRLQNCVELVFTRNALQGLGKRQLDALGLGLAPFKGRVTEDFRLSRELEPTSLHFLSDRLLVQALIRRRIDRAKQMVPAPVKRTIKQALKALRGQPSAKAATN